MRRVFKISLALCLTGMLWSGTARGQEAKKSETPAWGTLRAAYSYDSKQALEVKAERQEQPALHQEKIAFTGAKGERVPAVFLRPKATGTYPCALLLHGLTSKKEDMVNSFGRKLVENGVAVFALDAPHHGERRVEGENQWGTFPQAVRQGLVDYRHALDYLATRKDVDKSRIGLIGYSMGAMMGTILGGIEPRVKSLVLCVAGDVILPGIAAEPNEARRSEMFAIAPSLFAGHIAPRPILMLNGKQDNLVREPTTKRIYDAAKEPKEILWYESGHMLPPAAAEKGVAWLTKHLKAK